MYSFISPLSKLKASKPLMKDKRFSLTLFKVRKAHRPATYHASNNDVSVIRIDNKDYVIIYGVLLVPNKITCTGLKAPFQFREGVFSVLWPPPIMHKKSPLEHPIERYYIKIGRWGYAFYYTNGTYDGACGYMPG